MKRKNNSTKRKASNKARKPVTQKPAPAQDYDDDDDAEYRDAQGYYWGYLERTPGDRTPYVLRHQERSALTHNALVKLKDEFCVFVAANQSGRTVTLFYEWLKTKGYLLEPAISYTNRVDMTSFG